MNDQISHNALKNRVILITGAGDGIGKQAALSYAKHGATLILVGRTTSKLDAVSNEILSLGYFKPITVTLDLSSATKQDYTNMADSLSSQFEQIDGILHSAGLLGNKLTAFEQIEESIFDEVMQVNVKAQLLLTQALLPLVKKSNDARILFTSSTVGHQGRALWGSYSISKFATEGMMQILADEMKETTIRVNAINPGGTRTTMRAQAFPQEDVTQLKTPEEIMPLYLYLMAPEGVSIHGQCIDAQPK